MANALTPCHNQTLEASNAKLHTLDRRAVVGMTKYLKKLGNNASTLSKRDPLLNQGHHLSGATHNARFYDNALLFARGAAESAEPHLRMKPCTFYILFLILYSLISKSI